MADIRDITVDIATTQNVKVNVDRFFTEFSKEWAEAQAEGDTREDFIEETVNILAAEGSLHMGAISFDEYDEIDVTIHRRRRGVKQAT
jgi:hypothetical protein